MYYIRLVSLTSTLPPFLLLEPSFPLIENDSDYRRFSSLSTVSKNQFPLSPNLIFWSKFIGLAGPFLFQGLGTKNRSPKSALELKNCLSAHLYVCKQKCLHAKPHFHFPWKSGGCSPIEKDFSLWKSSPHFPEPSLPAANQPTEGQRRWGVGDTVLTGPLVCSAHLPKRLCGPCRVYLTYPIRGKSGRVEHWKWDMGLSKKGNHWFLNNILEACCCLLPFHRILSFPYACC